MKRLTKVLLIIITIFFISISITSCGKKEKIRYEYNEIDIDYYTNSEYLITDTNVTANKCDDNEYNTSQVILYSSYRSSLLSAHNYIVDITDTVSLGIVDEIVNEEHNFEVCKEKIDILSPISTSEGMNRYEFFINRLFYFVVMANKETQYSIYVSAESYSAYDEIEVDKLMDYNGKYVNSYKIEGNNNVYCIENEYNGDLKFYSSENSLNYISIFTNDSPKTHFTLYFSKANLTTDKFKLKIRKATEYNILDIIDDNGQVYIPGDTNEWVVVKVPDELDCSFIHAGFDFENSGNVLARRMVIKDYYPEKLAVISWEKADFEILPREICIRKGMTYRFVEGPRVYLEVNGKTYDDLDTIELHQGDMIGAYEIIDGIKKYYAFNLRCNYEKRQNRQEIVDFMSLSKDGPVEVTKTNEEIKKIKYIDFIQYNFHYYRTMDDNKRHFVPLQNTYKVTNGEA